MDILKKKTFFGGIKDMHLDNRRLQSIQRYKALIQNKIDHETDPVELETWSIILREYQKEEKQILERLDVKR